MYGKTATESGLRILFDARPAFVCTGIGRYTRTLGSILADGLPGHACWSLGPGGDVNLDARTPIEEEFELPALLEREAIDVLHTPLWRLPAVLPSRAVVTIHDMVPAIRPDLTSDGFARFFEGAAEAAERADAVVCPSASAKRDVVAHLGVPEARVRVIPETPAPCFRLLEAEPRAATRAVRDTASRNADHCWRCTGARHKAQPGPA